MPHRAGWTREQLLVAFDLYCQLPFGRLHSRNPEIIEAAARIGRTPSALAMKLTNIASLDPAITSTGRKGLRGASAADRSMWEEMQADWQAFAIATNVARESFGLDNAVPDISTPTPDAEINVSYTGEDKVAETRVRIGQHFFRKAVLSAYDNRCCITGLAVPALLVASHIVPWRSDTRNRLNPRNGLALSALHDKAFDIGLITITETMTVRVSRAQRHANDAFWQSALLAYDGCAINLPEKFRPEADFLQHHRDNIFQG